jgi:hypothetical protein
MEEDDNIMPPSEAVILAADAREVDSMLEEAAKFTASIKENQGTPDEYVDPTPLSEVVKMSPPSTKETKASIVSSIIRLQEVLRIPNPRPESHWNRMNKPELAQHLADLQTMGHEKLAGTVRKIEEKVEEAKQSVEEVKDQQQREAVIKDVNKLRESKASTLFWVNWLVVKVVETTSMTQREKWKLESDLEGFGDDVMEDKDEIEAALAEVYSEHKALLDPLLSGGTKYASIMMGIAANRYGLNKKHKKT